MIMFCGTTALIPVVMGIGTEQLIIEYQTHLDTPAIKVAEATGEFVDIDCKVIPGKVIVQGVLQQQTYLVTPEGVVFHVADNASFSKFIVVENATPNMSCRIIPEIEDICTNLVNEFTLGQRIVVSIKAILIKEQEVPFSPQFRMQASN